MAKKPKRHPLPSLASKEPGGYLSNPSGGYEAVPNELLDPMHPLSPTMTGEPASRREALIDLKAMAAWDNKVDRSKGELLAGTRWLAERWRWKRMRVHRFLTDLNENGTISWCKSNRKGTPSRIIIVGYARIGTATATTRRDDVVGTMKPQQPSEKTPLPWDDAPGTTGWDGNGALTQYVATASHQKGDEGGRACAREGDEKKETEPLPFELGYEYGKRNRRGHYCDSCGAPIGPTVDQCAKCAYGSGVTR